MSDNARPPNTTARAPFDDTDADVILRTSDHVDFHVFRLILTLSSPFFQGMFSLPQPAETKSTNQASTSTSTPPSIDVAEDSHTLDTLLRILYPNTRPAPFRSLTHALRVALAASKYVMSTALEVIADAVGAQYATEKPLQVYLIACRMGAGWEEVARAAAKRALDPARVHPCGTGTGTRSRSEADRHADEVDAELLHFPGAGMAYHRLEGYRAACQNALEKKLDSLELFDSDDDCEEEEDRDGISEYCLAHWRARYLTNIKKAVSKSPTKDRLEDISLTPDGSCGRCSVFKLQDIVSARLEVASRIDQVLSEVELRFTP